MNSVIDDNFLFLDNTIILFKGRTKRLVIPSKISGFPVECIGSGAVCEDEIVSDVILEDGIKTICGDGIAKLKNLNSITLPDTIESIDEYAFDGSRSIRSIDMILKLDRQEYDNLLNGSGADIDGVRILWEGASQFRGMTAFANGLYIGRHMLVKPVKVMDPSMRRIFVNTIDKDRKCPGVEAHNLCGGESSVTEQEDILDKIISIQSGYYQGYFDISSEQASDGIQKQPDNYREPNVFIPCFDEKEVIRNGDRYEVRLHYLIGTAWWYSVKRIAFEGKTYYAASKCFLTGEPAHPYVRIKAAFYYYPDGRLINDNMDLKGKLEKKNNFLNLI